MAVAAMEMTMRVVVMLVMAMARHVAMYGHSMNRKINGFGGGSEIY